MKTPPEMLSPKDCAYLADLLETLLTIAKKACDYSKQSEDEQIIKATQKNEKLLKDQYSTLLSLLK